MPNSNQVSCSYTELYAARPERRAALSAKKGFDCLCPRCVRPPAHDLALDGWRCQQGACTAGVVPEGALRCAGCAGVHALRPAERAARDQAWRALTLTLILAPILALTLTLTLTLPFES